MYVARIRAQAAWRAATGGVPSDVEASCRRASVNFEPMVTDAVFPGFMRDVKPVKEGKIVGDGSWSELESTWDPACRDEYGGEDSCLWRLLCTDRLVGRFGDGFMESVAGILVQVAANSLRSC